MDSIEELPKKLPADFKAKWIAALRSGTYKQGRESLYTPSEDSYCCLGVACVVAGLDPGGSECDGFIRYGISDKIPHLLKGDRGVPAVLAELNDGTSTCEKGTFSEIADYIENNL